ncbi:MAG TPA: phosphoadenylyl-sulfate reductase [Casimicrobiaceae bacterium]
MSIDRIAQATALIADVAERHGPAALASSFGAEDMVLIDLVAREALPVTIFTLDTGRLPAETLALIDETRRRYAIAIDVYRPDAEAAGAYVREHGLNAFYRSIDLRERCCAIRKTEPLARALADKGAWITGLRRSQSTTRRELRIEEFDATHGLPKFNPLADWTDEDVWAYVRAHRVPYNPLHDRGYPSIGCAPCTRAVAPGEDIRAGRWWWEQPGTRECGLHRRPLDLAASSAPIAS